MISPRTIDGFLDCFNTAFVQEIEDMIYITQGRIDRLSILRLPSIGFTQLVERRPGLGLVYVDRGRITC